MQALLGSVIVKAAFWLTAIDVIFPTVAWGTLLSAWFPMFVRTVACMGSAVDTLTDLPLRTAVAVVIAIVVPSSFCHVGNKGRLDIKIDRDMNPGLVCKHVCAF
jgi:hypothetical protein